MSLKGSLVIGGLLLLLILVFILLAAFEYVDLDVIYKAAGILSKLPQNRIDILGRIGQAIVQLAVIQERAQRTAGCIEF